MTSVPEGDAGTATGPTEEELAAVLAALRLRRAGAPASRTGPWASGDDSPLSIWRHRRLATLGLTPRTRP